MTVQPFDLRRGEPNHDKELKIDSRGPAEWVSLMIVSAAVIHVATSVVLGWELARTLSLIALLFSLLSFFTVRLGKPRLGILIAMAAANVTCLYSAYAQEGLKNVAIPFLPVLAVLASLLLDRSLLVACAAMTSILTVLMSILRANLLGIPLDRDDVGDLVLLISTILLAAAVGYVLSRQIQENLRRIANSELQLRAAAEALKASEERWQLALRGSDDGIWDANIAAGEVYFSDRWKTMLGYNPDEIENTPKIWERLVHPEDLPGVNEEIAKHLRRLNDFYNKEYRMLAKDGSYRWILARGRALWDDSGNPIRMVGSHTDVTSRRTEEDELRKARQLADAANRAKSEFLANMSHELRTPMNAILGITSLLEQTNSDAERREYLQLMKVSSNALHDLLTKVLDLSRIEAGRLDLEAVPFSPRECLWMSVNLFSLAAREKGIPMVVQTDAGVPGIVVGDSLRLRQVLANLIGNALKFTSSGSVSIRVQPEASSGHGSGEVRLRFEVADQGIGIPSGKLDEIFEPFRQADGSTTRRHGGSGLGLAIAKQLVEAMKGRIWVESQPGVGSTFYFSASFGAVASETPSPANFAPEETRAENGKEPSRAAKPARVLLAEDNLVNQKVAARLLQKSRHEVTIASDGEEAVRLAAAGAFDLVLMDLHMPGMNGITAAQEIRRLDQRNGTHTPIWALTASVMETDRQECIDAGMDGFLTKPIQLADLLRVVESIPCRSRAE